MKKLLFMIILLVTLFSLSSCSYKQKEKLSETEVSEYKEFVGW